VELYDPPIAVTAEHDVGPYQPVDGYPGGNLPPVLRKGSPYAARESPNGPAVAIGEGQHLREQPTRRYREKSDYHFIAHLSISMREALWKADMLSGRIWLHR
jgi:hypothetical protein